MHRDEKSQQPEAAHARVKVLRQVFTYAVDNDLVERNPAKDVPYIKTGSEGSQSRLMSAGEAITNVVIGFAIAIITQIVVFPAFGLAVSLTDNLWIGTIFPLVSLARSYVLRQQFNAAQTNNATE
jgi:hypothetical protein